MLECPQPQMREGHRRSDSGEPDKPGGEDGGAAEKKGSSSAMFSSKSHRKNVNPAHQSLKKLFLSKSTSR